MMQHLEQKQQKCHVDAILRKAKESTQVSMAFFDEHADRIAALAQIMADRFLNGGRLLVMGNGGSSCDAEHVAVEFMHPIFEKRRPLPALSLSNQTALITAISNDSDFSKVYSSQLDTLAAPGDMILAISTSGMSPNLVGCIKQARQQGLLTIAFTGKDGGRLSEQAEWEFIVPSFSIHRIQECHVMLLHVLWDLVHIVLGEEDNI